MATYTYSAITKIRCLSWYILTIITCSACNFSLNAYTKEDLERAKNIAGVVELISALPLEFLNDVNPECAAFFASTNLAECNYAQIVENLCSRSLESDENIVSIIARLLKIIRLKKAPLPISLFIAKTFLMMITNRTINNHLKEQKYHLFRRCLRCIAYTIIDSTSYMLNEKNITFDNQILTHITNQYKVAAIAGIFVGNLISNGTVEYLGEKIIEGANKTKTNSNSDEAIFLVKADDSK